MKTSEKEKPTSEELAWIKSLQRVLNKQPDSVCVFVASGTIVIHRKRNATWPIDDQGSVDRSTSIHLMQNKFWDGGDY